MSEDALWGGVKGNEDALWGGIVHGEHNIAPLKAQLLKHPKHRKAWTHGQSNIPTGARAGE